MITAQTILNIKRLAENVERVRFAKPFNQEAFEVRLTELIAYIKTI